MTICPPDNLSRQSSAGRTDLRPTRHNSSAHFAHSPSLIGQLHQASRSLYSQHPGEPTLLPSPFSQRCGLRAGGRISLLVCIEHRDFQKPFTPCFCFCCTAATLFAQLITTLVANKSWKDLEDDNFDSVLEAEQPSGTSKI
jgi:hypothetical protein